MFLWCCWSAELPADVSDTLAARFTSFKYWYTEPTPDGVVDQRWYWSENHRLIFHTIEYLAGQAFPAVRFNSDGRLGTDHRATARERLQRWFDEKARYGFSEWHSDVYYEKDLAPLLALVELADEEEIIERAQAFLDLLLVDVALHVHRGNFGATHGRSYMKDKREASVQPMFGAVKLCFGGTDAPFPLDLGDPDELTPLDEGATLLAIARKYRPPAILRRIAASSRPMIDREGMGLALDPEEPLSEEPGSADGHSYSDPDLVSFWWDRSALTAWQLVGLTMDTLDRHRLWDSDLFAPIRPVRELTGGDRRVARQLAHDLAPIVNGGLLTEVNTMTYRTAHVMLSTAQSYRPGRSGFQQHVWQATLDERAVVFTTHPGNEPWPDPSTFHDLDHYWTGSGTLPRSAQHGSVAMHLYSPAYASPELDALAPFRYLDYTHAFFPSEHFDEVVQQGNWTLGCRRGAFVALWSWREPTWREHDPAITCTGGLARPFDLVAAGGSDNVWVVEVGDLDGWPSFGEFVEAVAGRTPIVRRSPIGKEPFGGFDVVYESASQGRIGFGQSGPFTVDGREVSIADYPRFDNPWCQAARGADVIEVTDEDGSLTIDLRRRSAHDDRASQT